MQRTDPTSSTRSNSSDQAAIFVSLEFSRAVWLVTALLPGVAQKMSRHQVTGGDLAGLLGRFAELQRKAHAHTGQLVRISIGSVSPDSPYAIDKTTRARYLSW
jgi:hypothetical protein